MNTKDFTLRDNEVAILTDGTVIMNINCFKNNMISNSQLYEDDYDENEYGEQCCNIGDDYVEDYPEYYGDEDYDDEEYNEDYDEEWEDDYDDDENNRFPTMEYLLNLLSTPQGKLLMAIAKANERSSEDFEDFDDDCD